MSDRPSPGDRPANRLANETSPYLLQHADNPVDWYPWGPEALAAARALDRPIFLSIGYAACHWCHVMAHESFEDEATADDLRRDFIAIKVDREERPDIDAVYMAAVQAMTGGGGWPMSVFLTPDGRPFYGGTYFPPSPRHGLPGFRQVLAGVADAWRNRRSELEAAGSRLVAALDRGGRGEPSPVAITAVGTAARPTAPRPDRAILDRAAEALLATFDDRHGGWGGAPKFPPAMTIGAVHRLAVGRDDRPGGDRRLLAMARRTLDAMADGGIHDQLGGGFHRYATDAAWRVPHFEQMLYDNALLADAYLESWLLTGSGADLVVATETLDFIARDLRRPDGPFAASLDADTDGIEGGTFTWTVDELRDALGEAADLVIAAYGVGQAGMSDGRAILARIGDDDALAAQFGIPAVEAARRLATARSILRSRRADRSQPASDDKAVVAWNGLAIGAFARAAAALSAVRSDDRDAVDVHRRAERYRTVAAAAADAILAGARTPSGGLARTWTAGRATGTGALDDHADLADGLLALYEATFEERWFVAARDLAMTIVDRFADPDGGFFDTATDAERLITRPKELQDNAVPSGGSMATIVLLRLAALTGDERLRDAAEAAITGVAEHATRHPTFFGRWLAALDLATAPGVEVAIVGPSEDPATDALRAVVRRGFRPRNVVASGADPASSSVPLLQGRFALDGRPTAFVCRDFACRQPVVEPEALAALLVADAGVR